MKTVFLISGKARSGKNLFAEYLAEVYETNKIKTSEYAFAKELKRRCAEDIGKVTEEFNNILETAIALLKKDAVVFTRGELGKQAMELLKDSVTTEDDWTSDNKKPIVRKAFQIYGTEIYRNRIKDSYWVDFTIKACEKSENEVIFITDVRYENEIEAFQNNDSFNCISIRMERDPNKKSEKVATHTSETCLDSYDQWTYIVDNNDTLDSLFDSAVSIYEDIQKEPIQISDELLNKIQYNVLK